MTAKYKCLIEVSYHHPTILLSALHFDQATVFKGFIVNEEVLPLNDYFLQLKFKGTSSLNGF